MPQEAAADRHRKLQRHDGPYCCWNTARRPRSRTRTATRLFAVLTRGGRKRHGRRMRELLTRRSAEEQEGERLVQKDSGRTDRRNHEPAAHHPSDMRGQDHGAAAAAVKLIPSPAPFFKHPAFDRSTAMGRVDSNAKSAMTRMARMSPGTSPARPISRAHGQRHVMQMGLKVQQLARRRGSRIWPISISATTATARRTGTPISPN